MASGILVRCARGARVLYNPALSLSRGTGGVYGAVAAATGVARRDISQLRLGQAPGTTQVTRAEHASSGAIRSQPA